jgi:hypothetical protein
MSRGFLSPSFSVSSNFTIRKLETNKKVALGFATIPIITRSIFRAIELSNGFSGALANNEVLYMILEPPMISLAVIALSLCHPGVCFQGSWSSAKSAYKDAREKLHSKDSNDNDIVDIFSGRENGMELETMSRNV